MDRGKASGSARLSLTEPVACTSLEALCHSRSIAPAWGRTQGAPCKTALRGADGEAFALPFVAGPGRKRLSHWQSAHAPGSPTSGTALASPLACAQQFCRARPVRAPKAEKCFAHGKALPKTCRSQARWVKGERSSLPFPFQKRAGHRQGG